MDKKLCEIEIDAKPFNFEVKGNFSWGVNKKTFFKETNIISKMNWINDGYTIIHEILSEREFNQLFKAIHKYIKVAMKKEIGFEIDEDFALENYHQLINNESKHQGVIKYTKDINNIFINEKYNLIDILVERFSEVIGFQLSSQIKELGRSVIQIRISRPNSFDINPPHKDSYISAYEDVINLWIPIIGCNSKSSLPVYPGSHLLNENQILRTNLKGASLNNNIYNVPCILKTSYGKIKMIRPNPKLKDILLFTPHLIHGAAINWSNKTRVALELRLPRK